MSKYFHHVSIFDLDNCLSDDGWRIPAIAWAERDDMDKRYAPYHERCAEDKLSNDTIFRAVTHNTWPIFITARPENYRAATVGWLHRHLEIVNPMLMMREANNHERSVALKARLAQEVMSTHRVMGAFDDREDVVRAYRALGIHAARLWIHDEGHLTSSPLETTGAIA